MSSTALRRVTKELGDIQKQPIPNVTVSTQEDDLTQWEVVMAGPSATPYKGGKFKLSITFGADYPFKPPSILFKQKIYHPNVDSDGNICLGMLKTENWKPATKVSAIISSLYDLLETPNPDDPLVASIADQYRSHRKDFDKTAAEYTAKYAS